MSPPEHSPESDRSGCVLVVDDNDDLRHMWCLALQSAGFDVIAAGTQVELQRRLVEAQPHALLINLQRSEADGLVMLSRMRARQALREVPIVFLSGIDDDDFQGRALSAGADWVGVRPLRVVELQSRVSELVRHGRPVPQEGRPCIVQLKRTG
jgi:DNA-binding response OmpR family regulator